ncbi:hypothetical protein VOLCADRAFT_95270 [Volvox carteri f. nagariensis]|uniref:Protein kinase domain-containing protein n=1 Tax=Volvox carteri f. nagariensis TaxID=3068 RepID=D8U722_VOLCA|nr:uncharacterized protein VOLCADRAFT_95270 [Volvox carteri f. nagariensis]EFJ44540.1 hypothetical protein VOLCADRAFT_95270 [Volvox carteri f. nagariensis]|eukprot:XP_002954390.1 hypothetical protein VOLCADRAFT_95270 [Volvox carteri f. nagariensis]
MRLLSCLFCSGAQRRRSGEDSLYREQNVRPVQMSAGEATTGARGMLPPPPEAAETGMHNLDNTSCVTNAHNLPGNPDKPADAFGGSPSSAPPTATLASQLVNGLTFSTRVLGIGSYGIVVQGPSTPSHTLLSTTFLMPRNAADRPTDNGKILPPTTAGSFDGLDVAVKFMVSSRRTGRAAVHEMTLGAMPALSHPHICKSYDTRSAVMTDALFDELESHRKWQQRRLQRQRQMLQQQQPCVTLTTAAPPGTDGDGAAAAAAVDSTLLQSEEDVIRRQTQQPSLSRVPLNPDGERVLQFYKYRDGVYDNPVHPPDRLRPLESNAPLAVLHEILFRLGATVGHSVTLIIMELCGKGTLSRAIHRGIFAPCELWNARVAQRALIRTAAEIARALLHLHKSGVVHGDMKPGNVLLKSSRGDRRGFIAKIGDFGLSHLLPAGEKSLDTDTWGTPSYMAPEALLGHASTASDVWSFGVMLSEALTKQLPYGGSIEPARLVVGILDGSLELAWPAVRIDGLDMYDVSNGSGGPSTVPAGAAARLARQYGLVFPATTLRNAIATGGGTAASSIMGTSGSTECGNTSGMTPFIATVTSVATTTMLGIMTGTDEMAHVAGAASAASASNGSASAATAEEEADRILACLVHLGRRCTSRDPVDRPCFSEILGELIDMEIVLKTSRPMRSGGGGSGSGGGGSSSKSDAREVVAQKAGARARSRLALGAPTAAATLAAAEPPADVPGGGYSRAVRGGDDDGSVVNGDDGSSGGPKASRQLAAGPAEVAAAAAAVPGPPSPRDRMESFLELVSQQVASTAAQQTTAAELEAEAVGQAMYDPLPPPPPPLPPVVALAAPVSSMTQEEQAQDDVGQVVPMTLIRLPGRELSLALDGSPSPDAAAVASRPSSTEAAVEPPLQLLLDPLPAPPLGSGNIWMAGRAVGPMFVGNYVGVVSGPGPGTPEVSEHCCVVSKISLELLP